MLCWLLCNVSLMLNTWHLRLFYTSTLHLSEGSTLLFIWLVSSNLLPINLIYWNLLKKKKKGFYLDGFLDKAVSVQILLSTCFTVLQFFKDLRSYDDKKSSRYPIKCFNKNYTKDLWHVGTVIVSTQVAHHRSYTITPCTCSEPQSLIGGSSGCR